MAAICTAGQHAILINGAAVLAGDASSIKVVFRCLTGKNFEDGPSYRLYLKTFCELQGRNTEGGLTLAGGEQVTLQDPDGRIIGEGCVSEAAA